MPKKVKMISTNYMPYAFAALIGLSLLSAAAPALAHRLLVYAFSEGDVIHVESKFVGGGPVQKGQVQVRDRASGQVLINGMSDERGKFSFPVPAAAAAGRLDLLIVVEGGMGHQGEWLLKAASYLGQAATTPEAAPAAVSPPVAADSGAKPAAIDLAALEAALDKSLERHLAPIKEMLAEQGVRRTTLPDIIGGLGYIAGIFGLAAYFLSRKPKP